MKWLLLGLAIVGLAFLGWYWRISATARDSEAGLAAVVPGIPALLVLGVDALLLVGWGVFLLLF